MNEKAAIHLGKPAKDGAVERRDLSLRFLVLADLTPGVEEGEVFAVTPDDFESVLGKLSPQLKIEVRDRIGMGKKLNCSFVFRSMDDFRPDGIVAALPVLRALARARALLQECLAHRKELDDVRREIQDAFEGTDLAETLGKTGSPAGKTSGGIEAEGAGIDALLDKVELPKEPSAGAASIVDVLSAIAVPGKKVEREKLETLVREIDLRLSRQVGTILAHPRFTGLEAAWTGLKFLVERLDFRKGIMLDVLPSSREAAVENFFEKVFHDEYEGRSGTPLNFVLADYSFGRSKSDLDLLKDMAKLGAGLSVSFITAMSPAFWGVRRASMLNKLPDLLDKIKTSEYAKWRSFRQEEDSLWLTLTANRFLLRTPYSGEGRSPRSFGWIEEEADEKALFGEAVWAMGAALGQSFAEAGYRFPCAGRRSAGVLENLPLPLQVNGTSGPHPLEVLFGDRRAFELSECGFAPLMSQADSDMAYFNMVPSFHQAKRYEDEEATRTSYLTATLPYRGFAGAVAHELDRIARTLGGGMAEDEIIRIVREELLAMLAPMEAEEVSAEAVDVEVLSDAPELRSVFARLRPSFEIYGGPVDLIVGASIPR